jgi:hypothetical protein
VVVAAERFAVVLEDESPPPPDTIAEVRAILRTNQRLRDGASRN